jgi:hypothetical protein
MMYNTFKLCKMAIFIFFIFIITFISRNFVQIYVLLIVIVTYNILNNIFRAQQFVNQYGSVLCPV